MWLHNVNTDNREKIARKRENKKRNCNWGIKKNTRSISFVNCRLFNLWHSLGEEKRIKMNELNYYVRGGMWKGCGVTRGSHFAN